MSRGMASLLGSPVSTIPQNDFRTNWKINRANQAQAQERIFSKMLQESISDGIRAALGQAILGVLTDQGLLDRVADPKEFHRKLQMVFGNGAAVIEKIVIKDLYRKINHAYIPQEPFSYADALEAAKTACLEVGTK